MMLKDGAQQKRSFDEVNDNWKYYGLCTSKEPICQKWRPDTGLRYAGLSLRFSAVPIPTPFSGADASSDIKRPQVEAAGWKHEDDPN